MAEVNIEVKQSLTMHGAMLSCYLVLAIPEIVYFNLPVMKLALPFWTVIYLFTVAELIKKNNIQRLAIRDNHLYIRKFLKYCLVENKYKIDSVQIVQINSKELPNGDTLSEFEIRYYGRLVGRFNDSRHSWDLKKLHAVMSQIEG
ncbi:hypothetical protein [Neolewinella xylanilytica]|uniref:hypothetical protein n=1 Tax=Neolewinella xylanilytica TaxID=1514080 RepID=UPI000CEAE719|nr:hypothetical protein [Neolewinella xylanilytica]